MLLGIDIGGTKCALTVGDKNGKVFDKVKFATPETVRDATDMIVSFAKKFCAEYEITACGISCGGPLDETRGIILSPPNLPGWDGISICDIIQNALGMPAALRNDANACAMAEYFFGAGRGCKNMLFLTFGTGLGAGIILNGKLYSGTNGNAGEIGHMRLAAFGPAGYGKCGSFEGFCSGSGIAELAKNIKREAEQRGEAVLWETDAASVAEFAKKGDKNALKVFEISGRKLGQGLALLIDILNPEKIIIGSVFMRCEDLLRPFMQEEILREALPASARVCEILAPELGESIGDVAALAVAAEL